MAVAATVDEARLRELQSIAAETRRLIVEAIYEAQAGHLGGPLSAADMVVALYFDVLRIDPKRPDWPARDRFILSKGHSSIVLYAVFIPLYGPVGAAASTVAREVFLFGILFREMRRSFAEPVPFRQLGKTAVALLLMLFMSARPAVLAFTSGLRKRTGTSANAEKRLLKATSR